MLKLLTIVALFLATTLNISTGTTQQPTVKVVEQNKDDVAKYIDSLSEDVKILYSMSNKERNTYLKKHYGDKPMKVSIIKKVLLEYDKSNKEIQELKGVQIKTLHANLNNKESIGNGILLSAIAWKESTFGLNKSNPKDGKLGSYGSHQILLTTSKKRVPHMSLAELKQKLITDERKSMKLANDELAYWTEYYKKDTKLTDDQKIIKSIASYNAGFKADKIQAGKNYVIDVVAKAVILNITMVG